MELAIVQGGPYCAPEYHSFPTEQGDKTFIMLTRSMPQLDSPSPCSRRPML